MMLQFKNPYTFDKMLNVAFYAGIILPAMGVLQGVLTVGEATYATLLFMFAFLFVFVGYTERMLVDLAHYLLREIGEVDDDELEGAEVISINSPEELNEALNNLKEKITKDIADRATKREKGED